MYMKSYIVRHQIPSGKRSWYAFAFPLAFLEDFDFIENARVELLEDDACEAARETGRVRDGSDFAIESDAGDGIGKGEPLRELIEDFLEGNKEYPLRMHQASTDYPKRSPKPLLVSPVPLLRVLQSVVNSDCGPYQ